MSLTLHKLPNGSGDGNSHHFTKSLVEHSDKLVFPATKSSLDPICLFQTRAEERRLSAWVVECGGRGVRASKTHIFEKGRCAMLLEYLSELVDR